MPPLTPEQLERYNRQLVIPEIGQAGQDKLLAAKALIVGVGGLGSPCAYYLAAAGVGTIGLVDADAVELSNLQRQILHTTADLGRAKVESGAAKLRALNPDVSIEAQTIRVKPDNVFGTIDPYDVIVDASDNFGTKYLLNDACHLRGKPLVHAGILAFSGQMMTIVPGRGACLRCAFPEPPPPGSAPTPKEAGVLGAVPGVVGAMQAAEAIKLMLGVGATVTGALLTYSALTGEVNTIPIERDAACALCGDAPTITRLANYEGLDP